MPGEDLARIYTGVLQEADLDSIHRYCLSLDSLLRKMGGASGVAGEP